MRISKKRKEMGEDAWKEHQRQRILNKTKVYQKAHPERWVNYKRNTKQKLIEYKGGKCEICGYDKLCPSAYDFHHTNPEEKEFTIAGKSLGFETAKKEVDKCQLLCKRCHAEIHDEYYKKQKQKTIENIKNN
jgi:hypothetical protein